MATFSKLWRCSFA